MSSSIMVWSTGYCRAKRPKLRLFSSWLLLFSHCCFLSTGFRVFAWWYLHVNNGTTYFIWTSYRVESVCIVWRKCCPLFGLFVYQLVIRVMLSYFFFLFRPFSQNTDSQEHSWMRGQTKFFVICKIPSFFCINLIRLEGVFHFLISWYSCVNLFSAVLFLFFFEWNCLFLNVIFFLFSSSESLLFIQGNSQPLSLWINQAWFRKHVVVFVHVQPTRSPLHVL